MKDRIVQIVVVEKKLESMKIQEVHGLSEHGALFVLCQIQGKMSWELVCDSPETGPQSKD